MSRRSAGLLMYRRRDAVLEVFLVHPGGPYWSGKDVGAWSVPKGEYGEGEGPLEAARREFREETGFVAEGNFRELKEIKQKGGKVVRVWSFEADCDPRTVRSNEFEMEWPPGSKLIRSYPEIDRAEWFSIDIAKRKILASQVPFLEELEKIV